MKQRDEMAERERDPLANDRVDESETVVLSSVSASLSDFRERWETGLKYQTVEP